MATPTGELFNPVEDATTAALAAFYGSPAGKDATYLPKALAERLQALGLAAKAVRAAGRLALEPPLTGRGPYGSPTVSYLSSTARQVKADEPGMRAAYTLAAARRLTRAITLDVWAQAMRLESNYLGQHRHAGQNRLRAAVALDAVAAKDGPWLIWQTQRDNQVEQDCKALQGRVFTVDALPNGEIPGSVHPFCRCYATGLASGAVVPINYWSLRG